MVKLGKRWQLPAVIAVASGPLIAAAEGTGQIELPLKSIVVYVLAGGLTVISAMFGAIMYFLKKEHAAIVGGISKNEAALSATAQRQEMALEDATTAIRDDVHKLRSSIAAVSITLEHNAGEFRAELAKCVKVSDNAASLGRLHEKVNALDRALAYMRAKMGLDEVPPPRADEEL